MPTFAIYNYQFAKIVKHTREERLFGKNAFEMDAEEAFPQRQEIFSALLEKVDQGTVPRSAPSKISMPN